MTSVAKPVVAGLNILVMSWAAFFTSLFYQFLKVEVSKKFTAPKTKNTNPKANMSLGASNQKLIALKIKEISTQLMNESRRSKALGDHKEVIFPLLYCK